MCPPLLLQAMERLEKRLITCTRHALNDAHTDSLFTKSVFTQYSVAGEWQDNNGKKHYEKIISWARLKIKKLSKSDFPKKVNLLNKRFKQLHVGSTFYLLIYTAEGGLYLLTDNKTILEGVWDEWFWPH